MMNPKQFWTWLTYTRSSSPPPTEGYIHENRLQKAAGYLSLPCTESSTRPCHVLIQPYVWNQLLFMGDMELGEVVTGSLELRQAVPPRRLWHPDQTRHSQEMAWLLREHRCIKTLRLVHDIDPAFRDLLHCALLVNQGLKKLVLGGSDNEQSEFAAETVLSLVGAITELEELELYCCIDDPAVVQQLGNTLQKISTLTSVKMLGVSVNPANVECMLQGLKSNRNIAVISVQDFFLRPGTALVEFAAFSRNLRVLALRCTTSTDVGDLENLFEALSSNHHLEELRLEDFTLEGRMLEALTKLAAKRGTLKGLEVKCNKDDGTISGASLAKLVGHDTALHEVVLLGGKIDCLASFGEALGVNTTMTRLSLRLVDVKADELELFLNTLACNKSLQVTLRDVSEELLSTLYQLRLEAGLKDRVTLHTEFKDPFKFASALKKCTKLPLTKYEPCRTRRDPRSDALYEPASYYHLTQLSIKLETQIDDKSAADLALFLSFTRTLTTVELHFPTAVASTRAILGGLSRNTSISVLRISQWTFKAAEVKGLWYMVGRSKTLNNLHITDMKCAGVPTPTVIPRYLFNNHCLISAIIYANFEGNTALFALRLLKVLWRNRLLLRLAEQFVMGARGKCFSEAFKKVVGSPALVARVQRAAGESREQAMERVMESKHIPV
ncbi:hypothetical protein HPB47_010239 [Ixodes persulcatus]|uniref:Uncharacterized protein n=1 Tax=Ixodes persulcatus TaxID=34615 RepID=A0AC60NZY4_IXOPE|nr:hypothetical protein HPB47_010239 [Ixodes persulcatus]